MDNMPSRMMLRGFTEWEILECSQINKKGDYKVCVYGTEQQFLCSFFIFVGPGARSVMGLRASRMCFNTASCTRCSLCALFA